MNYLSLGRAGLNLTYSVDERLKTAVAVPGLPREVP